MGNDRTRYRCRDCDHVELRWMGRCPSCGAWNRLEPEGDEPPSGRNHRLAAPMDGVVHAVPLDAVEERSLRRIPVDPPELSRVLGGGLVPGSLILLGGAPGVGKSTLLTMLAGQQAAAGRRCVYLTAEESASQVRARVERLGVSGEGFLLLEEPALERGLPPLQEDPPALLVVDSIQTVRSVQVDSAPGSVSQIRFCGGMLADFARTSGTTVLLIGHVTKDGDLAGPRLLEHLVDTVLYFDSEAGGSVRMVRAFKNRFGTTGELAVLEMREKGLFPVRDASALFLAGRQRGEPGSVVTSVLTGSRPFLVELQALLTKTQYATPTRVVTGIDSKRVAQLAAILERKGDVQLGGLDVYVKVAGGLRLTDPAADLAVALALASSVRERALPPDLIALGEIGLTGELRPVPRLIERLREAKAHGYTRALVARPADGKLPRAEGELLAAASLREALPMAFEARQSGRAR